MYRILLVDDEALIREGVSENVPWSDLGYVLVAACRDGREAIEYIRQNTVDVVLTDICMPYMDGMELSRELCREFPRIKIIILSGYDDFEYASEAIKYRVEDYVLKPVTAMELGKILTRVSEKLDEERKKERSIYQSEMILRSEALWNLITGNGSSGLSQSEFEKMGIPAETSDYLIGIVQMDLYATAYDLDEKSKRESALMAFMVYNVCSEIMEAHNAGSCVKGKDHRTCILFRTDKPREFALKIRKIGAEIIAKLNDTMKMAVTIGLGCYVNKPEDLYKSYEEALKSLGYRYVLGSSRMIGAEDISGEAADEGSAEEMLAELQLAVKINETDKIAEHLKCLMEFLQENRYEKEKSWFLMQRIVEETGRQLRSNGIENTESVNEGKENAIRGILHARGLDEAVKHLEEYCMAAGELFANKKNTGGMRYAMLALDYMEKHYGSGDLNLNSICEYLNISTSRFSAIFKSVTGETFMEALTRIRMQKAKELLENTDLKNYEIAEKIGFSNPHYFSIAFKKMTGMSPTEYSKKRG